MKKFLLFLFTVFIASTLHADKIKYDCTNKYLSDKAIVEVNTLENSMTLNGKAFTNTTNYPECITKQNKHKKDIMCYEGRAYKSISLKAIWIETNTKRTLTAIMKKKGIDYNKKSIQYRCKEIQD